MLHRIYLVRGRAGLSPAAVQEHWRQHHSAVFGGTPGLRGYVQERPLAEGIARLPFPICSETWFDDQAGEREAYGSDYYRATVTPDEASFMDRGSAWRGRVLDAELVREGPRAAYRLLGFGTTLLPDAPRLAVLRLDREPPAGGPAQVVSAWFDDREQAGAQAARLDGLVFVAEAHPVVPPPEWAWE